MAQSVPGPLAMGPPSHRPLCRGHSETLPTVAYEREPGAASRPLSQGGYRRREPEKTVLYGGVQAHLETFHALEVQDPAEALDERDGCGLAIRDAELATAQPEPGGDGAQVDAEHPAE